MAGFVSHLFRRVLAKEDGMIIDCNTCDMRETSACNDCVVSVLVGENGILELADAEQEAIDSMSRVGLVSPIRLVVNDSGGAIPGS
jgi:hypothetical protein